MTINYFDEDTGKKIKESDIRKTTDYRLPGNIFEFEQMLMDFGSKSAEAFQKQYGAFDLSTMETISKAQEKLDNFKKIVSSWVYNKEEKKFLKQEPQGIAEVRKFIQMRDDVIKTILDGNNSNKWVSMTYNGMTLDEDNAYQNKSIQNAITPPQIKGYVFDFGIGRDAERGKCDLWPAPDGLGYPACRAGGKRQ